MESSSVLSLSPSFNRYSSRNLAEIAARVVEEFRAESENGDDIFICNETLSIQEHPEVEEQVKKNENDDVEDDDFEFAFDNIGPDSSPVSADEIFFNGKIRPMFPIDVEVKIPDSVKPPTPSPIRLPLSKLFMEDRDPPSCSSSEADEMDGILPESYCVWRPKASVTAESSPGRCKKSNSTGSSKRWKIRDLLRRSNSEGKDTFIFFAPSNANANRNEKGEKAMTKENSKVAEKVKAKGAAGGHNRRRSFLPYRQDVVGFFS